MNRMPAILFIIAFNLAPIFGVLYFNWQPFEAFWFFWLETLIMAVFNCIRIIFSQGRQSAEAVMPMQYHVGKAISYLLIRIFVFLFYSIFIIVFIGFIANSKGDKTGMLMTLVFRNRFFNLGLLISIMSQAYYLLFYFFRNRNYIKADPSAYAAIFDGRQLIMHVAVVLGTFAGAFLAKQTSFSNYAAAAIIGVFCICKCAVELFNYSGKSGVSV